MRSLRGLCCRARAKKDSCHLLGKRVKGEKTSEKWAVLLSRHSTRGEQHKHFWRRGSKLRGIETVPERISVTAIFICTLKTHLGMLEGCWKCCTEKWRNEKNIPKCPDHQPDEAGSSSEMNCADPARSTMSCAGTGKNAGPGSRSIFPHICTILMFSSRPTWAAPSRLFF